MSAIQGIMVFAIADTKNGWDGNLRNVASDLEDSIAPSKLDVQRILIEEVEDRVSKPSGNLDNTCY